MHRHAAVRDRPVHIESTMNPRGWERIGCLLVALSVMSLGAASAAAQPVPSSAANPCNYSVNYLCYTTFGGNMRASRTVFASGNYVRETSVLTITKTAGGPIGWVTGTADTVFETWGATYDFLWCDSGDGDPSGVVVGCNYT